MKNKPKNLMKCQDEYTTGNILDFLYHQNYCKFIGIDLSRKTTASITQQINIIGKLEKGGCAVMILLLKDNKKLL